MNYLAPSEDKLRDMLVMFFGEDTQVEPSDTAASDGHVAVFIDDADQAVASCSASNEFANFSGAAFSMIARDIAQEAIEANQLDGAIADNFHEVMNLCSTLLMNDNTPHLRLQKVINEAVQLPEPCSRFNFKVNVPNYGTGVVSFDVS